MCYSHIWTKQSNVNGNGDCNGDGNDSINSHGNTPPSINLSFGRRMLQTSFDLSDGGCYHLKPSNDELFN